MALSAARLKEMDGVRNLSGLDLLVIQIGWRLHMDDDLILVERHSVSTQRATSIRSSLTEGAMENAATVQALIDNLVERGLDPTVPRLFIIDGAKALTKAIRRTCRSCRGNPALSGPQGPQHYGAIAQIAARFGSTCVATSLGAGRCRQG